MAELLKLDGTSTPITPENGVNFQLDELYNLIECESIEVIYLKH